MSQEEVSVCIVYDTYLSMIDLPVMCFYL